MSRRSLPTLLAILCITLVPARALAATPITCDGLNISLSDNKNYYVFSATASGDSRDIVGYTFDFGDHQSYSFTFGRGSQSDHRIATATHTYQTVGTFNATAKVNTKVGNKTASIQSQNCKASIAIALPDTLPNTGSRGTVMLFISSIIAGAGLHHLWVRRRNARHKIV